LDFGKVNKSMLKLGYEPYFDLETKEWGTEPDIVGKSISIKCVKTSTDKEGKEYKSLIEVTKIGTETPAKPTEKSKAEPKSVEKPKPSTPVSKGILTPELTEAWKEILGKVLTEPLNEISINTAVKKLFPDELSGKNATHRKTLADVRSKVLVALVNDGTLELTEDGKYQLAA
jgi:hypothetical protein